MRKLILFLVALSGYAIAHNECPLCSSCTQWEFRGNMKDLRAQENFWRNEELVCEKHKKCQTISFVSTRIDKYWEELQDHESKQHSTSSDENKVVVLEKNTSTKKTEHANTSTKKTAHEVVLNAFRRLSNRR